MQLMKIEELKPHPRNSEFFDDMSGEKWQEFLESIKTSGVIEPIVITQDKVIVSGHQRVRACKELGKDIVMVDVKIYDNEDDIIEDMIMMNMSSCRNLYDSKIDNRFNELIRIRDKKYFNDYRNPIHNAILLEWHNKSKKQAIQFCINCKDFIQRQSEYYLLSNELDLFDKQTKQQYIDSLQLIIDWAKNTVDNINLNSIVDVEHDFRQINPCDEITTFQHDVIKNTIHNRVLYVLQDIVDYSDKNNLKYIVGFKNELYKEMKRKGILSSRTECTPNKQYDKCIDYIKTWYPMCGVTTLIQRIKNQNNRISKRR